MSRLPEKFVEMIAALEPQEQFEGLVEALESTEPSVSVRVNRAKGGADFEGSEPVKWCADGVYLPERIKFTFDPRLHQGLYYPQDASSMAQQAAVAHACELLKVEGRPMRYLDACAAPGGKTTASISALPEDAFVVANEFDPRRTSILCENLAKWGTPTVVTRGDASKIKGMDGFFDIIAADVPCSGEGMMRKDEQAVAQWSQGLVEECAERQLSIVDNLWRALRPGGIMIYSTCTFNTLEDEQIVKHLVDEHEAEVIEIPALNLLEIGRAVSGFDFPAYRFLPGRVRGEGLFMAMLRKSGDAEPLRPKTAKVKPFKTEKPYLTGDWLYTEDKGVISAIPMVQADLAAHVAKNMYVVASGIEVGTMKGRDLVPSQPLALAQSLNTEAFPTVEIECEQALTYLRREAIALPEGAPRGIVLLTYEKHPLGFVKNLGNRANNLYPQPWRILTQTH